MTYWLEAPSGSRSGWLVWLTVACVMVPSAGSSQTPGTATGVITGTVIDTTGAVLRASPWS